MQTNPIFASTLLLQLCERLSRQSTSVPALKQQQHERRQTVRPCRGGRLNVKTCAAGVAPQSRQSKRKWGACVQRHYTEACQYRSHASVHARAVASTSSPENLTTARTPAAALSELSSAPQGDTHTNHVEPAQLPLENVASFEVSPLVLADALNVPVSCILATCTLMYTHARAHTPTHTHRCAVHGPC